jgi:hypothetical protein
MDDTNACTLFDEFWFATGTELDAEDP